MMMFKSVDAKFLLPFAGDDSSNEDQGEERAEGDGEDMKVIKEEEEEEEEGREEETADGEFSFPDTTISLTHLQPSR